MITSFWNLCRACPSMPVEKLHSEYRSTFQWHEYVGSHSDSVTQPPVVRQPSQSQQDQLRILAGRPEEPSFPRRKKHPELANRSSNGWLTKSSTSYEASLYPESRFTSISGASPSTFGARGGGGGIAGSVAGPRKSISLGAIQASGNIATIHSPKLSLKPEDSQVAAADDNVLVPLTSSAPEGMSGLSDSKGTGDEAAYGTYVLSQSTELKIQGGKEPERTQGQKPPDEFKKKEYKSEYKKRFRPFSQYEYIDGKFFKKKGDHEIGDPWYKEVIELRKKAGEYKFRGWGTELGPQNIADVYHQHVWDQVSRRTSLAALALITTTPKSISKEEKDKENAKKSYPGKPTHARPHTATPKHPISDLEKSKHFKDVDAVQHSKKKWEENRLQNRSTSRVKARSHSAGPAGRSPRKAIRQQSAASSVSEKDNSLGGWKVHLDSAAQSATDKGAKPQQRHPRPTTLATSPRPKASSGKGDRDPNSKLAKQQQFDKNSADPYLGYNEPVVKSPPEPTRVKSPEQVILRSPDPVNWTVPLDTTKSFTVTQNIREAPPSPRFRAGEKLHGDIRNIHHPTSTHHSSAGSTMASSPISSFSTRSAPVPLSSSANQPTPPFPPPSTSKPDTSSTTGAPTAAGGPVGPQETGKPPPPPPQRGEEGRSTSGVLDQSIGSVGGGGGGGGGMPDNSGAGPGTGKGSSSSKPLSQTSELETKQISQSETAHRAANGLDDAKPQSKSLHKDKPPVKSSPHMSRSGAGALRSKDVAKHPSSSSSPSSSTTGDRGRAVSHSGGVAVGNQDKSKSKISTGPPTLKCLEDPTFMFDPSPTTKTSEPLKSSTAAPPSKGAEPKGGAPPSKQGAGEPLKSKQEQSRISAGTKSGEAKVGIKSTDTHKSGLASKPSDSPKQAKSSEQSKGSSGSKLTDQQSRAAKPGDMLGKTPPAAKHEMKGGMTEKSPELHKFQGTGKPSELPKSTTPPVAQAAEPSKPPPPNRTPDISKSAVSSKIPESKSLESSTDTTKVIPTVPSRSVEPPRSTQASKIPEPNKLITSSEGKIPEPHKSASYPPKIPDSTKPDDSSLKTLSTVAPSKQAGDYSQPQIPSVPATDTAKSGNAESSKTPEMTKSIAPDPSQVLTKNKSAESSKIPEMTKSSVLAESSKIPEMTKSMMITAESGTGPQDVPKPAGLSKIPEPTRIPEMKKLSSVETSKIPEMIKSTTGEIFKSPDMTKSILGESGSTRGGYGEVSRIPQLSGSSGADPNKMSDMTKSILVESSKIPEMTKSVLAESSKIPEMTKSVLAESSKIPEMTKSVLVESSKIPEMTKSVLAESSKIPEMTKSVLAESSKIPEMTKSMLAESSKIPEMTKSMLSESSRIPEPFKHKPSESTKTSDPAKNIYSEPTKIPEPMKPTFDSSKIPDPMKPTFDVSKIPEPSRPLSLDSSKAHDSSRPASFGSKIPEFSKSIPEANKGRESSAAVSQFAMGKSSIDPFKSGIPAPTKIPEPVKSSPLMPSKMGGGLASGGSSIPPIPGNTDPSVMTGSIARLHSTGIKVPSSSTSDRGIPAKGSLRVLEAPSSPNSAVMPGDSSSLKRKDFGFVPPTPVSIPKRTVGGISHVSETPPQAKGSGYRVLEAPEDPGEPTVSIISPSSSRSRASDVLEKARHRFDKFWGKGKEDDK